VTDGFRKLRTRPVRVSGIVLLTLVVGWLSLWVVATCWYYVDHVEVLA
jgi:hypothetical protein